MTPDNDPDYKLQRQIDQLEGKVDRVSDQLTVIRESLNDKFEQIRKEADIDRRSFQQALSTMNTQLERNTQSMSSTETKVALIEVELANLDALSRAEDAVLGGRIDGLSSRLWWVAGIFLAGTIGIIFDVFKGNLGG